MLDADAGGCMREGGSFCFGIVTFAACFICSSRPLLRSLPPSASFVTRSEGTKEQKSTKSIFTQETNSKINITVVEGNFIHAFLQGIITEA